MDADTYPPALGGADSDSDPDPDGNAFVQGMTSAHHPQPSPGGFTHTGFTSIDPALNGHTQEAHHHHQQHDDTAHYAEIPRQLYANPNQYALHTPSDHLSESASTAHYASPKIAPAFTPTDRALPDKRVSDETIDDAYVAFILYCNPSVPLDCDSAELRKVFRQPPKSDGKTFNVYHLLQLIEKFERKDIKTWTKLATELGVERTAESSAQKVQQYAVRLKRWMHAMHVDAFFEYILNKPHTYYQRIPPLDPDLPTTLSKIRDGVPLEEDLALRALHLEPRPKRGRRRADSTDKPSSPNPKRPHLDHDPDLPTPHFLYPPASAISSTPGDRFDTDPWTAASHSLQSATPTTTTFRWRAYSKTSPPSAPPLLIPHTPTDELTPTTPSSAKPRRRRHGPAVSSAWPSSSNPLTGKLRGRPPTNRNVRDGPFSTFPANPGASKPSTPNPTPLTPRPPVDAFPASFGRPGLHLTVPADASRPVIAVSQPEDSVVRRLAVGLVAAQGGMGVDEAGRVAAAVGEVVGQVGLLEGAGGVEWERVRSEMEELCEEEEERGDRRYRVRWERRWGGVEGRLECVVSVREEQGGGGRWGADGEDEVEGLRRRVKVLERELERREEELRGVRRGVLSAVGP